MRTPDTKDEPRLLARQACLRHRPHRLQRQLAVPAAAVASAHGSPAMRCAAHASRACTCAGAHWRTRRFDHGRRSRSRSLARNDVAPSHPEVVLHLAAQSVVLHSYDDPVDTYSTNVIGTVHVWRRCGASAPRAAWSTSPPTSATRTRAGSGAIARPTGSAATTRTRTARPAPNWSAVLSRFVFPRSRLAEHGVAIASARAGNVIGGGDWTPRQLVPERSRPSCAVSRWSCAIRRGAPMAARARLPRGLPAPGRGADDRPGAPRPGSGTSGPPTRLAARGGHRRGAGLPTGASIRAWEHDNAAQCPPEELMLRLDVSKAAHHLGWTPRLPVDRGDSAGSPPGIATFTTGAEPGTLCLEQIRACLASVLHAAGPVPT